MELRFLSAGVEDMVDPDGGKISLALTQLPESSSGGYASAVLVHDNGKDFLQYVAKGAHERNCLIQYCEYREDGAEFRQYFTPKRTIEQVIKLFQRYASGDPEWKGKIAWMPLKSTRTPPQAGLVVILAALGISFGAGGWVALQDGHIVSPIICFVLGLCLITSFLWIRPTNGGAPGVFGFSGSGSSMFGDRIRSPVTASTACTTLPGLGIYITPL